MLHVYALAEHPAPLPEIAGIDGSALRVVTVAPRLDAVVGEVSSSTVLPDERAVLAHARVVEKLATTTDALLPARFERPLRDEEELAAVVREREGQLRESLERVRGSVELGVRVLPAASVDGSATAGGRDYLEARLEAVRGAERVAAELQAAVADVVRESSVRVVATSELVLTAAYLVAREGIEPFSDRVRDLEAQNPAVTFVCTGPWPPYSFVTLEAAAAT
jgi:hypothetical protein